MKKKVIVFTLVAAMALQAVACSKTTEKQESSQKTTESQEVNEEVAAEQEQALAQTDADAISEQHTKDNQNQKAVEQTNFGRVIPCLEESANWKRTESSIGEGDMAHEVYQCNEKMKFLCESAATDNTDTQTGLEEWISGKGWILFTNSKNEELSETLKAEVYNYEALQDDNGYSMYHQGVYFIMDGYWYVADFSVMEGEYTDYAGIISEYLSSLILR